MKIPVKNIGLFIFMILLGIQSSHANDSKQYDEMWKKYQSFISKGSTRDALQTAQNIYDKALKENQTDQKFKATIHIYKNRMVIEENSEANIINDLKSSIQKSTSIDEQALLKILLAQSYFTYYSAQQYKILERTYSNERSSDFAMWDAQQFQQEISNLYFEALNHKNELKKYPLDNYSAIISKDNNAKFSLPIQNLSDLLFHEAIQYFSSGSIQLIEASNAFQMNQKDLFSSVENFVKTDLSNKNSSNEWKALELYQEWIANHLQDKNLDILSYIDHQRLRFVYDHYVGEKKNDLYAESLEKAYQHYTSATAKALFKAELIQLWYQERTGDFDYTLTQIVEEAQILLKDYPNTLGAVSMQDLIHTIQSKSLHVTLEEFIPANQPFKTFVAYRNLSSIRYKIVEWKEIRQQNAYQNNQEVWNAIQKLKVVHSGNFKLPASEDYSPHSIEFALNGLAFGKYALITYTEDVLNNIEKGKFTISPFQVTDIAITFRENQDNIIVSVLNRKSGLPFNQIPVEVLTRAQYNQDFKTTASAFTNQKGEVYLPKASLLKSYYKIQIKNGVDKIETPDQYYNYQQPRVNKTVKTFSTKIFTDRSIYRQGQEVFFKGILISNFEDTVRPGIQESIEVIFRDANYQEVSKQTFTTNEYGSFSGFFRIPEGGLNGNFTLQTPYGAESIQVEDYKRPTFEVTVPPIEGNFQLGDSILVKGQALAYSGANISQATVNYIVQRKAYFPIWGYYGRYFPRPVTPAILTSGATATDENGNFEITFIAEKDKNNFNIYDYKISIEVTDITGEVRSNISNVRVGKNSVLPGMEVDPIWIPSTASTLKLSSKNLQNVAVSSIFQIKIETLIPRMLPKKSRYWSEPDQFSMTEAEHNQLFPYDIYKEDPTLQNLKIGKTVWSNSVQILGDSTLEILPKNLPIGVYKITSIVLDKKDTIHLEQYFEVKAPLASSVQAEFVKITLDKKSYLPGSKAIISFDSDLPEAYLRIYRIDGDQIKDDTAFHIKGQAIQWEINLSNSKSANTNIYYELVAQNRIIKGSQEIPITTEKYDDLQFKWTSFRNKLLPGAQEKWSLQILDKNNQWSNAELLATMYDASLDQFAPYEFAFNLPFYRKYWYSNFYYNSQMFNTASTRDYTGNLFSYYQNYTAMQIPSLNLFGWQLYNYNERYYYTMASKGAVANESMQAPAAREKRIETDAALDISGAGGKTEEPKETAPEKNISLRTNFNETAFFYPMLKADKEGIYSMNFTMPDALTTWKFQAFAHTEDLHYALLEEKVISQKDLMIQLNAPRFVRKGDEIYLNARLSNLSDKQLSVEAKIVFRDASTNEDITSKILSSTQKQSSEINSKANQKVEWMIKIPKDYDGIIYEVTASSRDFSDGESNIIPVLENRVLLTESTPIFINKKGKYEWNLKDLAHTSNTLETKSITFEYTSQPVWHALMALPYLNEQDDASATSLFQKFYANSLAAYILKSIPESKTLLEAWKKEGSLKSTLEKNQELKSVVLEATPWLRDAQDETAQMQGLLKLFSDAQNPIQQKRLIEKLEELQYPSGGISWFPNMPENQYITQSVVLGFYQLQHLGAIELNNEEEISAWMNKAQNYLTNQINKTFSEIKRTDSNYLKNNHLGYHEIQYLLLISHLKNKKLSEAEQYFYNQAQQYALDRNNYSKAAIAITLNRMDDQKTALTILNSLKQSAVYSKKEGMYWKATNYRFWYDAPIETQALIIQAFDEIAHDENTVNELKTWLLRQKQTHRWNQPKATADASYALLLTGGDWKTSSKKDVIKIDKNTLSPQSMSIGTAYVKNTWQVENGDQFPERLSIKKKKNSPSWGAIYYQYWEDLDQVKSSSDDLNIKRTLYKVTTSETGEQLESITSNNTLKVGDKIRIKLELNIQKDVEYFHLQDVRASGFEPANVISGYKYQGGLGYYEVNGDAATHWYFNYLPKGNFVFEYTVYINTAGKYSSGISTGECLYAPEFRFQTNGGILNVEN
ncbi:MAG TPA: alpha-2-macroglobulin family protein [Chitinophagales bacterium]|nr:alpha-2-macroglobulin family protein [Chitinophagales bacterium]